MDNYYATRELAKRLKVEPQTVRKWRLVGRGPRYTRLGTGLKARVVYSEMAVQEWLDKREFHSTTEETAAAEQGGDV